MLIRARIAEHGCFPLVATVAGFVDGGAEITDVRTKGNQHRVLRLRPAGEWFGEFAGRRWPTGPGRPWVLYRGPGLRGLASMGESGP